MAEIGEKVLVRQWENMKNEYGTYDSYCIRVGDMFVPEMRRFCGQEVTISYKTPGGSYHIKEDTRQFFWIDDMFVKDNSIEYWLQKEGQQI